MKRAERCSVLDRTIDSSGVVWKGVPLKSILMDAFQARWQQIEGPSWLETDCFDISATSPEGAIRNQLPAMLRALLAEKFKLLAHNEDRMLSGHALVVDKDGPKFNQDVPMVNFMGGKWLFGAKGHGALKGVMTMATLAANLSREGYGPVQDLTGLTGRYDIDLTWTPDKAGRPGQLLPRPRPRAPKLPLPKASVCS